MAFLIEKNVGETQSRSTISLTRIELSTNHHGTRQKFSTLKPPSDFFNFSTRTLGQTSMNFSIRSDSDLNQNSLHHPSPSIRALSQFSSILYQQISTKNPKKLQPLDRLMVFAKSFEFCYFFEILSENLRRSRAIFLSGIVLDAKHSLSDK